MKPLIWSGLLLCLACTPRIYLWPTGKSAAEAEAQSPDNVKQNYCESNAGRYVLHQDLTGQQMAYCVFIDGSACEASQYYQGLCQPGDHPGLLSGIL